MTNVVQSVTENRQWIFDGIGGSILTLLVSFGVFLYKRRWTKPSPASTPPVNSAAIGTGNVSIGTVNVQSGGVTIGNTETPRLQPRYDELRRIGGGLGSSGVESYSRSEETQSLSDGEFDTLRYLGVKMNYPPVTIDEIARGLKLRPVEVLAHVSKLLSEGLLTEHMSGRGAIYRISGPGAQRLVAEQTGGRSVR